MTFPDIQFGYIDASRNAQKLIAVRFFSTLANYAAGDFVVQGGKLYFAKAAITAGAFNSTQWTQLAGLTDIPAPYVLPVATPSVLGGVMVDNSTVKVNGLGVLSAPLPIASTTVLGGVKVDGTSIIANGSGVITATTSAVQAMNDNRIINGDMRIDQRNNGAAGTSGGYTIDRWQYSANQASKGAWGRIASAFPGFPYALYFGSTSAFTPAAGDYFAFSQAIEADMVSDFQWGSANAQPVTLSFWVASTLTGMFGGSIHNYDSTRSCPFSYSIPTANTATRISITIPGDTAGTWVMSGNAGSMYVSFDLGGGSSVRGPANAWASTGYIGVTGAVSVVATNGANFYLSGVKLEVGAVATPFNRQSLAKSMADCQRYYATGQLIGGSSMVATGVMYAPYSLPVSMRAAATLVITNDTSTNLTSKLLTVAGGTRDLYAQGTATSTTQCNFNFVFTASAEL